MISRFAAILALCLPSAALTHPIPVVKYTEQNGVASIVTAGQVVQNSQFAIASTGKVFTALAVAQLVEKGLLDFDNPIADFVDADLISNLGAHDVTIAQALTMTSGLPDYLHDDFFDDLMAGARATKSPAGALGYAVGIDPAFPPGQGFDYSNTNYLLLELLIEDVTGESYADVIQSQILNPIGLRDSFVFGTKALPDTFVTGHQGADHVRDYYLGRGFGDGAVISTAADMAKFYRA